MVNNFKHLTRDEFRAAVFARDGNVCVVCNVGGKLDAHHILERRLWTAKGEEGGYFLENGVTVCGQHHLEAEQTTLSCSKLRELCGIKIFPIPSHLYQNQDYDKWGNPILPSGMRLKGELFDDSSVQKALASVLALFTDRIKYPRTYHLPWSPGVTNDDRVLDDLSVLEKSDVVVTVKLDGENINLYHDYIHARSIDYSPHDSRDWIKALHAQIAHDIPKGWRVCGENLYAKHSIKYEHLESYLQVFSIWNDKNICLSWYDTVLWAELLGLKTVPALYNGPWNEHVIRGLYKPTYDGDPCEGYVVRVAGEFHYKDFRRSVAKWVRESHVVTDAHWMHSQIEPNRLKK